jgi:hypothetical protein
MKLSCRVDRDSSLIYRLVSSLPLHRLENENELKGLGAPSSSYTETLEGGIRGELCFKELAAAVVRVRLLIMSAGQRLAVGFSML